MCMTIRLIPAGESQHPLRELSPSEAARALGWRYDGRSRLGRHGARLSLHACDLLTDEADWDAPTWSMSPGVAEQLADSMSALLAELGDTAFVEALWEGEAPVDERYLPTTEFVGLVRRGEMATHTRYRIRPDDAPEPGAE